MTFLKLSAFLVICFVKYGFLSVQIFVILKLNLLLYVTFCRRGTMQLYRCLCPLKLVLETLQQTLEEYLQKPMLFGKYSYLKFVLLSNVFTFRVPS